MSAVSVCEGAQSCTRVTKCTEALHNKAFILTKDSGCEVFAKLPNPNTGPARLTIASEIATRKLLSDVLNVPVPRVLAWSFDSASSPIRAEYILEERFGSVWNQWPRKSKLQLITQVVDIQNTSTGVTFDMHGCIYLKGDLRALGEDPSGYTRALGRNEIAYIKSYAITRMNYYRSLNTQEFPEDGLGLLVQYMKVAPYLIPQSTNEAVSNETASNNVLIHPDLHLDNIFANHSCRSLLTGSILSQEEENITGVGKLLALFWDESMLPVDGMVEPKDYDMAQKNSRKFKSIFIGLAKDDEGIIHGTLAVSGTR
ncbi:hypothetical protein PCG10_000352 [Penicillium crustosum]|uniref:Altered inheritance of mitochondria protein 9, mitochondrial n=1 Tax=Penicillium crustosum TaxID=36656 RepID=A0A9P5GT91_PENCR|nr:hypothetical protein PCG10_000352 [Penicillium crustosum]